MRKNLFNDWFKVFALYLPASAVLVACGGGGNDDNSTTYDVGLLLSNATPTSVVTPAQFQESAPEIIAVTGAGPCTVTFLNYTFSTLGGAGEETASSSALMVPSGTDAACTGPRPTVLYAHGTQFSKNSSMADPINNTEASMVAATYAAHGYIVVAPDYAGYGSSTLWYHPYLMMEQQASEMMHALQAIKSNLPEGTEMNNNLFVTGYSQGGHVAMATQRAMQLAGSPVTAGAPLSGPYALSNTIDAVMAGNVTVGAPAFTTMLVTAAQQTYANIYDTPADLFEDNYAATIEGLLPNASSFASLVLEGYLPATNLFAADSMPQPNSFGFGPGNLIKTTARANILADIANNPADPLHPLRQAGVKNDLLKQDWTPTSPMLLCGGSADPVVPFALNTGAAQTYFSEKGVGNLVTTLDLEGPTAEPFTTIQAGFALAKNATTDYDYHGALVPPYCQRAAREYFSDFMP